MTLGAHRRTVVWVVAVLSALLTARLGVWQLDRAAQKLALQASLAQRAELPALSTAALARDAQGLADQVHRRVLVQGRWLAERSIYLDNRQMNGRPGFFVVTPLLLDSGDAVLVQRGWMPRNFLDRQQLAPVPTPAVPVRLAGRIAPPPSKLFELGAAEQGPIRQNLDPADYTQEIGVRLLPLSVLQLEAAVPLAAAAGGASAPVEVPDGLQRQWAAPAVDVGKHHGYAFQWFALCALITGLTLWFQLIRPRVAASRTASPP